MSGMQIDWHVYIKDFTLVVFSYEIYEARLDMKFMKLAWMQIDWHVCIKDFTLVVFSYEIYETRLASFIKFIRNDHSCKILFIIWSLQTGFNAYRPQNEHYFNKKTHCWHGRCEWRYIIAPKCIARVVIRILWHGVIHWITATSYEKLSSYFSLP